MIQNKIEINLSPSIPAMPIIKDRTKVNIRYMVIAPYVSIHIYFNEKTNEFVYEVEEPILNDQEKEYLKNPLSSY